MVTRALPLFETPLFVIELAGRAGADRALAQRLVAEAGATPGLAVSNRGGWHSPPDLAQRRDPELQALCADLVSHMHQATARMAALRGLETPGGFDVALTAWAMVMRRGDYTVPHEHPAATWSAAYYLDPGDDDPAHPEAGAITFLDPRRAAPGIAGLDLFPSAFTVRPTQGALLVFPGYLQHWVHPYRGERPRVAIAANGTVRVAAGDPA